MSEREAIAAPSRAKSIATSETLDAKIASSLSEAPTQTIAKDSRATGATRIGRFRLESLLGQGGMGAVYLAYDEELDRRVALKVPRFDNDSPDARTRFHREARAAAAVEHPHICPIYDVGESDGKLWLAMAYIEGQPLSRTIAPGKALKQRHVAQVVRKIALALAAAHAKGVVHRDLKPANIMLAPGKGPVVMDFGLAVRRASGDDRLTRTGIVMGTPAYMSPEQISGDPDAVGPSSDIYSLGVILYELLAGRPPFLGSLGEILGHIALSEPPPVQGFRPDIDRDLEAICLQAMAKRPSERYASMNELASALDLYLRKSTAPPTPPPTATSAAKTIAVPELFAAMAETPTTTGVRETLSVASISTMPAIERKAFVPAFPRPVATRRTPWKPLIGLGAFALLVLLGVVLLVRTPKGLIQIELSDPQAQVEVKVDGEKVKLSGIGDPLELTVGKHNLLVSGKDFETVSESFTVRKDGNPVLKVSLAPVEVADAEPASIPREAVPQASSKTSHSTPRVASTPATQTPARDRIWSDINPSIEPSWRWDAENKSRSYISYLNGVLTLDNGGVNFPGWYRSDLVLKAQIKFISGTGNVGLGVRNYYAYAMKRDGLVHFGIGENLKNGGFKDLATYKRNDIYKDYFELEFSAIRDQLVVRLNGERIMQVRATGATSVGAGLNAWGAKGMFKNVQARRP